MTEIAVADTHGLTWYARSEWKKLGAEARKVYAGADEGRAAIYVPAMVLLELAEAARRGSIRFPDGFSHWVGRLFSSGGFFAVDLTLGIVLRADELHEIPERGGPVDRRDRGAPGVSAPHARPGDRPGRRDPGGLVRQSYGIGLRR